MLDARNITYVSSIIPAEIQSIFYDNKIFNNCPEG